MDLESNTPEGFLHTIVHTIGGIGDGSGILATPISTDPDNPDYLKSMGFTRYGHEPVLLLPPSVAKTFAAAGWSKADIRAYLFEQVRVPQGVWSKHGRFKNGQFMAAKWRDAPPDTMIPIVFYPEAFQIIVVGGAANKMSYCPVGSGNAAVTKSTDRWK